MKPANLVKDKDSKYVLFTQLLESQYLRLNEIKNKINSYLDEKSDYLNLHNFNFCYNLNKYFECNKFKITNFFKSWRHKNK